MAFRSIDYKFHLNFNYSISLFLYILKAGVIKDFYDQVVKPQIFCFKSKVSMCSICTNNFTSMYGLM